MILFFLSIMLFGAAWGAVHFSTRSAKDDYDAAVFGFETNNGLTFEQELHNLRVKMEWESEERNFQMQIANLRISDRFKQFQTFKHLLDGLSAEEQLKYIPKWVNYLCKEEMREKNYFDILPPMNFDEFVVNEISPFHFCSELGLMKPVRLDIIYVP